MSTTAVRAKGGGSGLGYIIITCVLALGAIGFMHLMTNVINDNAYGLEKLNINSAQRIFAGEEVTECTLKDKVIQSHRGGPTYQITFHCNGNGSDATPGDFHTNVTQQEFNSMQVTKPYQVQVLDWGKEPNLPKFSITPKG